MYVGIYAHTHLLPDLRARRQFVDFDIVRIVELL